MKLSTLRSIGFQRIKALLVCANAAVVVFIAGCGTGGTPPNPGPVPGRNTGVTVLVTSTATSEISQFDLYFNSITLTSQSGKTVDLLPANANEHVEFAHLNGRLEPMLTLSVPQDVYTSATAVIGPEYVACVAQNSSGLFTNFTYSYDSTPNSFVKVNLPSPVTVSGVDMVLSLDLLVSQSTSGGSCASGAGTFRMAPTFNLSTVVSPAGIRMVGLNGIVASVDTGRNSFAVTTIEGSTLRSGGPVFGSAPEWLVSWSGPTVFQGISGISTLAAGMAVDMDAVLQPDGSLQATRIEVQDADPANLSVNRGPLLAVANFEPIAAALGREEQGVLLRSSEAVDDFSSATFKISGQFANLQSLPFAASFNSANMVAGQNVSMSTHLASYPNAPNYPGAATVMLMPQTLNGTVTAVSSSGGFTMYTVELAPYDLFPQLAVQSDQTTLLKDPSHVIVYADSNTEMLTTQSPSVGSVMRCYGLVFNDNGILRMDCATINDGVPILLTGQR